MDIPEAKRDGKLMSRLMATLIVGFDRVMDRESQLYLRLLARLVDKAFTEYSIVRECILEEIKENDNLAYRIEIINHLENCVSAISRASKIFERLANGVTLKNGTQFKRDKDLDIFSYISPEIRRRVSSKSVANVRNRVEHVDEDVYLNKFTDRLFLDVSDDYRNITINNKNVSLVDLTEMITAYHELVLEVFSRLPKHQEGDKYYYDELPKK